MAQKQHKRLLFYLKTQYLGHLNWLGEFPNSMTFRIQDKDVHFLCEGNRDWSHGTEAVYVEAGMNEELRRKVSVGCRLQQEEPGAPSVSQDDRDFLSSLGILW